MQNKKVLVFLAKAFETMEFCVYDGLNTFLSDLQFYKKWLPKNEDATILELCCGTSILTLPIPRDGYIHKYGGFEEDAFNDNSEKQVFVC